MQILDSIICFFLYYAPHKKNLSMGKNQDIPADARGFYYTENVLFLPIFLLGHSNWITYKVDEKTCEFGNISLNCDVFKLILLD